MRMGTSSIRALAYSLVAVIGGTIYGGEVCPFMDSLPVRDLGITILIPIGIAYGLRGITEKHLIETLPAIKRSTAQFRMELGLYFIAAVIMAMTLSLRHDFSFLQSGMKLVLGIFTVGFFAALDIALARERVVIQNALVGEASYSAPQALTPLTRRFSLVATFVLLLITSIMLLVLVRDVGWIGEHDLTMASIAELGSSVLIEIIFVMGFLLLMVINLVFSYARNLHILFETETGVLERVSRGDLSRRVPVTTNDELGVIAGHTNTMITSLRESARMRDGLRIAMEVQQHLLPENPPSLPGLDIAGIARFTDETGGDFYDFIGCDDESCSRVAIVVGDVSGHGIGAALLMAGGRALIRQGAASPGSPSQNITEANRHLSRDIGDTGRFMTLFFIILDPVTNMGVWVNAGHQPPLFYDGSTDAFCELKGHDIPLGVVETWQFHEHYMDLPAPGQILLIGTDGVWEAHNEAGAMYGPERLRQVIRENADLSAEAILLSIVESVRAFGGKSQEDDITLVVVKGVEK